jgi:hypothetical protein
VIAAGEKFQSVRIDELDEMAQATPAIVGERLLRRTESKLYSFRNSVQDFPVTGIAPLCALS